ncbi:MAG: hypothetical protein AB7I59_29280 [Geminicoccaceae bacterium]
MRAMAGAAACLSTLLVASGAGAQQATVPDVCPHGQMRGADGQCIPDTGTGQSGNPGAGTAAVEAAKGGAAAEPNKDNAPADASQLGPGAVGPSADDTSTPDAGAGSATGGGSGQ